MHGFAFLRVSAFRRNSRFLDCHHYVCLVPMFAYQTSLRPGRALGSMLSCLVYASLTLAAAFSAAQTPAASDVRPETVEAVDAGRPEVLPPKPQVDLALVLPLNA